MGVGATNGAVTKVGAVRVAVTRVGSGSSVVATSVGVSVARVVGVGAGCVGRGLSVSTGVRVATCKVRTNGLSVLLTLKTLWVNQNVSDFVRPTTKCLYLIFISNIIFKYYNGFLCCSL